MGCLSHCRDGCLLLSVFALLTCVFFFFFDRAVVRGGAWGLPVLLVQLRRHLYAFIVLPVLMLACRVVDSTAAHSGRPMSVGSMCFLLSTVGHTTLARTTHSKGCKLHHLPCHGWRDGNVFRSHISAVRSVCPWWPTQRAPSSSPCAHRTSFEVCLQIAGRRRRCVNSPAIIRLSIYWTCTRRARRLF